jgi:glycosyltransferase involved in cell wall biosynthesis
MKKKLIYLAADDGYFCSHRMGLAKAARQTFDVAVATPFTQHKQSIEQQEIKTLPFDLRRGDKNVLKDIRSIRQIRRIYKSEKPSIVHHIAVKPILYGTLACVFLKKKPKIINAFTGMGHLFTGDKFSTRIIRRLVINYLRIVAHLTKCTFIVQNSDDYELLLKEKIVSKERLYLIRGSGVDTDFYQSSIADGEKIKILCVCRMLKDKGIYELIEAAKILQHNEINAEIVLAGDPDPANPSSLTKEELQSWHNAGIINWLGHQTDIKSLWQNAHIAVLPSYREGLPKSLLEAAAAGKPIVTTDVPGCREVVIPEHNGYLVPAKNAEILAEALTKLALNKELRDKMGKASRVYVENELSLKHVIDATLNLYESSINDI